MSLIVIIPARYGSSRFPGKPLVDIAGKPMVQRVMERAASAKNVSLVAVATDDDRIKQAVEAFGGKVVMTESVLRSGSDRVAAACRELGLKDDDLVVNVQGDQPLLPPRLLEEICEPLAADPGLGMTTPVVEITTDEELHDPNHVKVVMNAEGGALYFSRQLVPFARDGQRVSVYKHLGVYCFTKAFLDEFAAMPTGRLEEIEKLEQLRVLEAGRNIRCVITELDSPEVDRPEDAVRVAGIINQGGE